MRRDRARRAHMRSCTAQNDRSSINGMNEMKKILKRVLAVLAIAATATTGAHAQVLSNTSTYSGLTWAFSTGQPGFSTCSTLFLDASGDVANSDNFVLAGRLACAN